MHALIGTACPWFLVYRINIEIRFELAVADSQCRDTEFNMNPLLIERWWQRCNAQLSAMIPNHYILIQVE